MKRAPVQFLQGLRDLVGFFSVFYIDKVVGYSGLLSGQGEFPGLPPTSFTRKINPFDNRYCCRDVLIRTQGNVKPLSTERLSFFWRPIRDTKAARCKNTSLDLTGPSKEGGVGDSTTLRLHCSKYAAVQDHVHMKRGKNRLGQDDRDCLDTASDVGAGP